MPAKSDTRYGRVSEGVLEYRKYLSGVAVDAAACVTRVRLPPVGAAGAWLIEHEMCRGRTVFACLPRFRRIPTMPYGMIPTGWMPSVCTASILRTAPRAGAAAVVVAAVAAAAAGCELRAAAAAAARAAAG